MVLNDNEMSIGPTAARCTPGAPALRQLQHGVRERSKSILSNLPGAKKFLRRWEEHLKGMVMPGTLFEELGFNYWARFYTTCRP